MFKNFKKRLVDKITFIINRPVIEEIDKLNRNINFLVNQSLEMDQLKTLPSVKDLQINEFKILEQVDSFLKEKKINYFLVYGTLLGAVRHRGFIPWDDDIDIAILSEDFDRFLSFEEELNKLGLKFSSPFSTMENYNALGWNKIYDNDYTFHISLFVFDLVKTDDIKKTLDIRTAFNKKARKFKKGYKHEGTEFSSLKEKLTGLNNEYYSLNTFVDSSRADDNTYLVKTICSHRQRNYMKYQDVFPLKEQEFIVYSEQEITEFPAPNNVDSVLEDLYSKDYMHFPMDLYPKHRDNW